MRSTPLPEFEIDGSTAAGAPVQGSLRERASARRRQRAARPHLQRRRLCVNAGQGLIGRAHPEQR